MNKKQLSEQEIRTRYITPAIQTAGWKSQQIREEITFTAGRIIVRGTLSMRSQERKRLDYLLYYKPNIPLALVEAKDNNHAPKRWTCPLSTPPMATASWSTTARPAPAWSSASCH